MCCRGSYSYRNHVRDDVGDYWGLYTGYVRGLRRELYRDVTPIIKDHKLTWKTTSKLL